MTTLRPVTAEDIEVLRNAMANRAHVTTCGLCGGLRRTDEDGRTAHHALHDDPEHLAEHVMES